MVNVKLYKDCQITNEAVKGLNNCAKVEAFCRQGWNTCSMLRPRNRSAGHAPPSVHQFDQQVVLAECRKSK